MITEKLLKDEIYEINHEGKKIFYAPLTREFDISLQPDGEIDPLWHNKAIDLLEVPDFVHDTSFASLISKVKIRLNVTNKCNLNCEYCSVSANSKSGIVMSDETAYSAIDNLFEYAVKNNASEIELTFSGGEPTLQIKQIEEIISYIDKKVEETGIRLVTKLLTNGVFPKNQIPLLSSLFNGIQVSWDGFLKENPRFGQDKSAQSIIWENIGLLIANGTRVNILTVVSEYNFHCLEKIIDDLYNEYGIEDIVLSIKDDIGKAKNNVVFNYETLRKNYIDMWKKYKNQDIDIPITGTDIHSISNHPCGISVPNFSVGPKGDISACTLSFNYENEQDSDYDIGKIKGKEMILDQQKIVQLQTLDIIGLEECSSCFAKWHCRGGCRYANRGDWLGNINPERCDLIRKIIADKILFIAELN